MSMKPISRKRSNHGFTLMEVLAALLVVVIVLPVVMRGISMATQIGALTRFRAEAATLAESKLAEVLVSGDWQYGDASGDFETEQWGEAASKFQWALTITPWQETTMRELRIDVTWQQRFQEQSVSLVTLVRLEDQ